MLNHDDLHVGPYGVESPHNFVYTATEVTRTVEIRSEDATEEREGNRKREDLEERLRMAEYEGRRD
jgi:hypothetical protein